MHIGVGRWHLKIKSVCLVKTYVRFKVQNNNKKQGTKGNKNTKLTIFLIFLFNSRALRNHGCLNEDENVING